MGTPSWRVKAGHTSGSWPGTMRNPSAAAIAFNRRMASTVCSGGQSMKPADGQLLVDVALQVGGVEGQDEAGDAVGLGRILGQGDDEALVARGVAVGGDGGDARRQLDLAVGQPPVDSWIVVVDADEAVLLGPVAGMAPVQAVVQFPSLQMDRHPLGEPAQPARMVVVQMAEGDDGHVGRVDSDQFERHLERVPGISEQLGVDPVIATVEALSQQWVTDQRHVESGVEQQPSAVQLKQDTRHRFPEASRSVATLNRDRFRQVLPTECQRHHAMDADRRHRWMLEAP